MDIIITGLLLGGTYALIAFGLNMQYGVARIMNWPMASFLCSAPLPRSGFSWPMPSTRS